MTEEMMSDEIGQIALALSIAQGKFKPIERKSINPFFKSKYADLASIKDGVTEALSANKIAVFQLIQPDENTAIVDTILAHESGQWIKSTVSLKPKKQIKKEIGKYPDGNPKYETETIDANDPQSMGSAITYARRYGLSAILGIATEDEDDGNGASGNKDDKKEPAQKQGNKPDKTEHWCSDHNTEFFMRGKMKSYAHPIEGSTDADGKQVWCYEHKTSPEPSQQPSTEQGGTTSHREQEKPQEQSGGMTKDQFLDRVYKVWPKWNKKTVASILGCEIDEWSEPWELALEKAAEMGGKSL